MTIQRITVKNFGSVGFYDAVLTSEWNVLDTLFTLEISTAIELLLCSKATSKGQGVGVGDDTLITAEVLLDGSNYHIELTSIDGDETNLKATDVDGNDVTTFYRHAMSHSWEQDAIESFDSQDKSFPLRLYRYRGCDDCEVPKDLLRKSNYLVGTKTFRSYLKRYIQTFEPEPINNSKNYKASINNQGKFEVGYADASDEIPLSETDEKLFFYICFLNVAEFWEEIEEIRDMHHENKPLLVKNFLEFLDQTTDFRRLISRTIRLNRQVILLTLPMDKQAKQKRLGGTNGCGKTFGT